MISAAPSINIKNRRRKMNRKNIFYRLALAMLMPTMLLTTACSNEDDTVINNGKTAAIGYTLPVTINVTRQSDDATTRATYNESTRMLSFSAGDKLFVKGSADGAGQFAGTLNYASEGTFSGTITTENPYAGTADALLTAANSASNVSAKLLPAGYATYGFWSIAGTGYEASVSTNANNAFAATKALAVEQFSDEYANSYSSGFALRPLFAVVNFTITGLSASTDVNVASTCGSISINGQVRTDGSGAAKFAIGLANGTALFLFSLSVDGRIIALPITTLEGGKIYNITRSATSAVRTLSAATKNDIGKIVGTDGYIYDSRTAANNAAAYNAVAMIAYVGNESDCSHGLAIALDDEYTGINWEEACRVASNEDEVTGGTWRLPSYNDWKYMFIGCGASGNSTSLSFAAGPMDSKLSAAQGTPLDGSYWTTTVNESGMARFMFIHDDPKVALFRSAIKSSTYKARCCLAF